MVIPLPPKRRFLFGFQLAPFPRRRESFRRSHMRAEKIIGAFIVVLGLAMPAWAGEPTAESFMKDKQTELAALVKTNAGSSNTKKIEAVFDSILDYDALAKGSLRD